MFGVSQKNPVTPQIPEEKSNFTQPIQAIVEALNTKDVVTALKEFKQLFQQIKEEKGDLETILKPIIDARDPDGTSLLHIAAIVGDNDLARNLLSAGADPNVMDDNDLTPLMYAANERNKSHHRQANLMVNLLLDHKAEIVSTDDSDHTVLFYAVINNNKNLFHSLIEKFQNKKVNPELIQKNLLDAILLAPNNYDFGDTGILPDVIDYLKKSRKSSEVKESKDPVPDMDFIQIMDHAAYSAASKYDGKLVTYFLDQTSHLPQVSHFKIKALNEMIDKEWDYGLELFIKKHSHPETQVYLKKMALKLAMRKRKDFILITLILGASFNFNNNQILKSRLDQLAKMKFSRYFATQFVAAERKLGGDKLKEFLMVLLENLNIDINYFEKLFCIATQFIEIKADTEEKSTADRKEIEHKQKDQNSFSKLLVILRQKTINEKNWNQTVTEFNKLIKANLEKTTVRPLTDIVKAFKTKNQDVEFPLEEKEVDLLNHQYLEVKKFQEAFIFLDEKQLANTLKLSIQSCQKYPNNISNQLKLLAIICEHARRIEGYVPYSTQIINILAMLNSPDGRRFAQIKTGEGKSLTIAILAAFKALAFKNHCIDIMTSSADLAVRDAERFEAFYASLGISVKHHTIDKGKDHLAPDTGLKYQPKEKQEAQIIYGTASDFVHTYLDNQLTQDAHECRPMHTVIVDEFDSPALDDLSEFIIGCANPGYFKEVVQEIWSYVNQNESKTNNLVDELKAHLIARFGLQFSNELINYWIVAARTAKQLQEKKDYVIINQRVQIVNYENSGEIRHGSRWQNLLHCFVELKHGLELRPDNLSHASTQLMSYLNKYKNVFGLTGTLGSEIERKDMQTSYAKTTQPIYYDSPPYYPSQAKPIKSIIADDANHKKAQIKKTIEAMIKGGRPTLILCQTIKETEELYELLRETSPHVNIYNDTQGQSAEDILKQAGKSGAVTIATNIAGRGADIIATTDAPLHVIATSLPANKRVEKQNFGRTGRQGLPGTYHYILSKSDLAEFGIPPETSEEKFYAVLDAKLKEKTLPLVKARSDLKKISAIASKAQDLFFYLPANVKKSLSEIWKDTINQIYTITQRYLMLPSLDPQNLAHAEKEVCRELIKFWEGCNLNQLLPKEINNPFKLAVHNNDFELIRMLGTHFYPELLDASKAYIPSSQIWKGKISKEEKLTNEEMSPLRLFVADMDLTCLGVHTGGIALAPNPASLRNHFKNPEKLIKLLTDLHKANIPIGIATFGTEIEFVSRDGKTTFPKLFPSGRESVAAHFEALLGKDWSSIISNIQAYDVEEGKIKPKIQYKLTKGEYKKLSHFVTGLQTELQEIYESDFNEIQKHEAIQAVYNKLHDRLEKFSVMTAKASEEKSQEKTNQVVQGKIPHITKMANELKVPIDPKNASSIHFVEDDFYNSASAKYMGFTVADFVYERDDLKWEEKIRKRLSLHTLHQYSKDTSSPRFGFFESDAVVVKPHESSTVPVLGQG